MSVAAQRVTRRLSLLCAAILSICQGIAAASPPASLRTCLDSAGFAVAASTPGSPDLDRALTSSECAATEDEFVAAFYYADELKGGSLGPLHLARFDMRGGRWVNAPAIDADLERMRFERGGSVLSITVAKPFILIETHATPSANYQLVLDLDLKPLASFCGFATQVMPDGSVFHIGCMVHFAATHQARLFVLDIQTGEQREVFPGARQSRPAEAFRDEVVRAYRRLPAEERAQLGQSVYGPVTDFDRSIQRFTVRDGGRPVGMLVVYHADRLGNSPRFETVAVCQRRPRMWQCEERPATEMAAAHRIAIKRAESGWIDSKSAKALIRAALPRIR